MSYDLELKEGKAILSNKLLTLLEAKPGDRIAIEYGNLNGDLKPIIRKSDSGNLLSKSNSFIFKGQDKDFLQQYGNNFSVYDDLGTFFLEGDHEFKVYTSTEKAISENYLDLSILTDTNYNITKFKEYKL